MNIFWFLLKKIEQKNKEKKLKDESIEKNIFDKYFEYFIHLTGKFCAD